MGGRGSGAGFRYDAKETTIGLKQLDVNWLNRKGYLQPWWGWSINWTRGGEPSGEISGRTEDRRIVLVYRFRRNGGPWEDVEQPIPLTYTPCTYGGQRPWFVCPGVVNGVYCGRRVGKLYSGGKFFLCRHCYDLAYVTQQEDACDRLLRKAQDIRERLGGSSSLFELYPPRPKGMHRTTYERLRDKGRDAERRQWQMAAVKFGLLR